MWLVNVLIIVYAILGLCLELGPKEHNTSKISKGGYFGRLIIGNGKQLTSYKSMESTNTKPQTVLEDIERYQSDHSASTAWHELLESNLRRLNPTVHCGDDYMILHVQGSIMHNFMIDEGEGPVPLTQIPANCGLSVTQDLKDTLFTVYYQGCHVAQQGEGYVLPLLLWGMPIKMSCTLAQDAIPIISCLASGMVTKISYKAPTFLKLKVNGKWDAFIPASSKCGITAESDTNHVVLTAPYQSSCWQIKDFERFLSIWYGNEEFIFFCPDSQDPNLHGHVRIISYQGYVPSVTPPTDNTNVATATRDLASNPGQSMSHPFSHMYDVYTWEIPAGTNNAPKVTSSPTTNPHATGSSSKTVGMMHPFPPMYYPLSPIWYGKTKPFCYPWAFPAKAPTATPTTKAPTTKTSATSQRTPTSTKVVSNHQQSAYHFKQMYNIWPNGHHNKPMLNGHPQGFPAKAPNAAPTTIAPNTKTAASSTKSTATARNLQSEYLFNQIFYPYGPMPYHRKYMLYGYPWAFPVKVPIPVPSTPAPMTTKSSTFTSNMQQSLYSFNQMFYPYGHKLYHRKPMLYDYPQDFSAKAPTASTTTRNPQESEDLQQRYYPYGPMPYHHRPVLYGYPWAFPAKAPTAAATTKTASSTKSTAIASNPQQSVYSFNHIFYPYGSMSHHHASILYGCPWAFPAREPTAAPTRTTTTTKTPSTTKSTTTASNSQQSVYSFNHMFYPSGPIPYHHKPMLYGYPCAFPVKVPIPVPSTPAPMTTTKSTTFTSNVQRSLYSFNQMFYPYGHKLYHRKPMLYDYLQVFSAKAPTASTTTARNPQESKDLQQRYYPYGPMSHHHRPVLYGCPWAFPAKEPTAAPTRTTTTTKTPASNSQQSVYSFNHMFYPGGPIPYHLKPMLYGYPWAFPANTPIPAPTASASTTKMATTTTKSTTIASNPQQFVELFNHMHNSFASMSHHHNPILYGYPWDFYAKALTSAPTISTPTTASTMKMATTSKTSATARDVIASDPQSRYPFSQRYYPFGHMHCHYRPLRYLGYPLTFAAKSFTGPTTAVPTN